MSMQDPIADMLTRLRNAGSANLKKVSMPSSKEKVAIADVLKTEGYITDYAVAEDGVKRELVIELKYVNGASVIEGIERVSKPSCRIYCGSREIPRVRNRSGHCRADHSDGHHERSPGRSRRTSAAKFSATSGNF